MIIDMIDGDYDGDSESLKRTCCRPKILCSVESLEISDNGLQELPLGLLSVLPNLTDLDASSNALQSIDGLIAHMKGIINMNDRFCFCYLLY